MNNNLTEIDPAYSHLPKFARALSVMSAPTIVRDGKTVFCGRPTSEEAVEALRRSA